MRTHHTLAAVAERYKNESVMSIARALMSYINIEANGGEDKVNEKVYKTAHYDPIILGFILGRSWPACESEVLAAIAKDLEYDKHIIQVSPRAESRVKEATPSRVVKGLDVSKLEFKL